MDLVEVEILECQAGPGQHFGHRHRGCHQQTFIAVDEIHRRGATGAQIGANRQVVGPGPVLGADEHGGRTVGQSRAVAGGQRALLAVERRFESGQLFHAGVRSDDVVTDHALMRNHQVIEESGLPGGSGLAMALDGQGVLLGALDLPFARHSFTVLAHRQTGSRFGVARRLGRQF